jgi:hypothetical protein
MNLFGAELPTEGTESSPDLGVTITVDHVEIEHGLVETAIIVDCVVKVVSGIAIKVIGDLLVDRLKNKKAKLTINDRQVNNISTQEIVSAMRGVSDAKK